MKKLKDWYYEGSDKKGDDFESRNFALKGSAVEIFLFYIGFIPLIVLSVLIWCSNEFHLKYSVLLIPTLIWVFLRSSRKDMTATGNWIAAIFGAVGAAVAFLLAKLF